jgi:hypothetical protein
MNNSNLRNGKRAHDGARSNATEAFMKKNRKSSGRTTPFNPWIGCTKVKPWMPALLRRNADGHVIRPREMGPWKRTLAHEHWQLETTSPMEQGSRASGRASPRLLRALASSAGYLNLAGAKALAAKPFRGCIGFVSPKQSILAQSELTDCATPGVPGVPVMCYVARNRDDLRGQREAIACGSRLGEGQNDKGGRPDSDNVPVSHSEVAGGSNERKIQ